PHVLGDPAEVLYRAVRVAQRLAGPGVPDTQLLQVLHQIRVDLEELAGQRLALEQVGDLRLDALIGTGDGGDGGGRGDGQAAGVAHADGGDTLPQGRPALRPGRLDAVVVGVQYAPGGARLLPGGQRAVALGEVGGGLVGGEHDALGDPGGEPPRLGRVEG